MHIVYIKDNRKEEWNTFVSRNPFFSLLQSWEWGEFKQRLGWKVHRIAVEKGGRIEAGAQLLIKPMVYGLSGMAYIPRGPLVDWQDREITSTLLEALHSEARKNKAICLRIEPPLVQNSENHTFLMATGLRPVKHTNQPRCSMIVHLPADMEELLKGLPASTRYNIRISQRKGVSIESGGADDLESFYRLMEKTGDRSRFPIRSSDYYEEEWQTFNKSSQVQLFLSRYKGVTIGVQMPFHFAEHAATFHAAHLKEYRNLKAGYLMMWTAMCWARSRGCRTFDLWGIPEEVGELTARGEPIPEGRSGGLWGVYYFKRSFRGELIYFVGAYDYVYSPLLYRCMEHLISRTGSIDKFAKIYDHFA